MSNQTNSQSQSNPSASSNSVVPDEETRVRIENLAIVGDALMSTGYSETRYGTDYFLAKEALINFKNGIDKLALSPKAYNGMRNLIKYLDSKIDKRMRQSNNNESLG
ncbi:MAG: hypothetical protein Kow0081_2030 [Candidatus Dojkabacteria bacterium]